jgi:protein-L-isoaspartate(D-aspartate) O-methyltransferase
LPIGHNQTISQPYIVARMIELLKGSGLPLRRVLEIGTGCGYQAAVLSCVAQEVYSIERIKPLHELAKANLRPLRIPNLRLHYGDGMLGLPQVAPFDGIILAAAGLEVPRALLEQLAIGARLVAPVGAQVQHLQRITRTGKSEWTSETLEACHFVPLRPGIV